MKFDYTNHVHAKYQLSSFYPDELRQVLDLFARKFQDFPKKKSEFSNAKKNLNRASQRASFTKI
jgi:hypothetical protein